MWQRKERSPEEARRPRLRCSRLLQKSKTTLLRDPKTKQGHENSLEWCWFTSRVITDARFSDKCQKSHAHLLFSLRTSHSIGPLPWNWGERSGGTFSFSNNRNRPWIQKANHNLTLPKTSLSSCPPFSLAFLIWWQRRMEGDRLPLNGLFEPANLLFSVRRLLLTLGAWV